MKKLKKLAFVALVGLSSATINAQGLGDLLKGLGGGGGVGDILGNVIEGVFTKSDLTLADLVGEYVSEGPAITFKSENLLQKAGGMAGAATIESKLKPYYEKYGLTGMVLTVDNDANFTMKVKGMSLKGTISKNDGEGTFNFNFQVVGVKLGKFTAYVEKSGSTLKLMFDASKLMDIISAIAKFTGNSVATTLGSLLDSYDGACIGFKMKSTGTSSSSIINSSQTETQQSGSSTSGSTVTNGLNALKDLLNKGK